MEPPNDPEAHLAGKRDVACVSRPLETDVAITTDARNVQITASWVNDTSSALLVSTEVSIFETNNAFVVLGERTTDRDLPVGYADSRRDEFSLTGAPDGYYLIHVTYYAKGADGGRVEERRYVRVYDGYVTEIGLDEFYEASAVSEGRSV